MTLNDESRCAGSGCHERDSCARYRQIALDRQRSDAATMRVSCVVSLRIGPVCAARREIGAVDEAEGS